MQSCFVSIPFGRKRDNDGHVLDFDFLYGTVIRPVVKDLGMESFRLDEFSPSAILQKTLIKAIITSDLMIADITTLNPNVLYEIGIRHALKRRRTLLISAEARLPWDLSYLQVIQYRWDSSGYLTDESASEFREKLKMAISQSQRGTIIDSPIYEFFPDIEVILPNELDNERRQQRVQQTKSQREFAQIAIESPKRAISDLKKSEVEVRGATQSDPVEYLTLLRKYRDLSEWDRVIALATEAPVEVAESMEVQHLLALALNRRGDSGDQDRAIALMEQIIATSGGNSEAYSILGLIYKDKYDQARSKHDKQDAEFCLNKAIEYYREGFKLNPKDYYLGINVVTLLLQRSDVNVKTDLDEVVPLVREAVEEKIESGYAEYWDYSTKLELEVITGDWANAQETAQIAASRASSEWMLEATRRTIQSVTKNLPNAENREKLKAVLEYLRDDDEEERNDD